MKIGILTYHRAHNHWAVLQAYALIKTLKLLGHEAFIIDYWSVDNDRPYDFLDFSFLRRTSLWFFSKIKRIIAYLFCLLFKFNLKLIRYRKFQSFIMKEFLVDSRPLFMLGEDIPDFCDLYIYGSDQIWRSGEHWLDPTYWWAFPVTKSFKITFAVSMWSQKFLWNNEIIKKYLNNFNAISVRENQLQLWIRKLWFENVRNTLDPIFLLDKKTWLQETSKKHPTIVKKRILIYYHLNPESLKKEKELLETIQNFARFNNYNLIEINGWVSAFNFSKTYNASAGPYDFLDLIGSAEFVITNSFHWVAFAILFNKQFYALTSPNNISRIENMLKYFWLERRAVDTLTGPNNKDLIDFKKINLLVQKSRYDTISFLKEEIQI